MAEILQPGLNGGRVDAQGDLGHRLPLAVISDILGVARAEMEETLRFLVERCERIALVDPPRWMPYHHIRCFDSPLWLTLERVE